MTKFNSISEALESFDEATKNNKTFDYYDSKLRVQIKALLSTVWESAEEAGAQKIYLGASAWREIGRKYKYWDFFEKEVRGDMESELRMAREGAIEEYKQSDEYRKIKT